MEYLFQAALFLLIAFALLILGTWRTAKRHYYRKWDREIAPAVAAKGRAQGYLDGERKGFSAGQIAMVKRYAAMTEDETAVRIVDAVTNRN
jgi:hypothetical protein